MNKLTLFFVLIGSVALNSFAQTQKGGNIYGEAAMDNFGREVCMPDASTIAISALYNDGGASNAGHVRVMTWNGSNWIQKGADLNGTVANEEYGFAISMPDANTIAISGPANNQIASFSGLVQVFKWNGSSWVQKGSNFLGNSFLEVLGYSVSMPDSNTLAIGIPNHDGNGTNSGAARIYKWNGTTWTQKGSDIYGEAANDGSGCTVSMPDTNTIAIGAQGNSDNGSGSGQVRVYTWNGSAWVQKGADLNGESANDSFGYTLDMPDANTLAVGAPYNDGNGTDAGHTRVFFWNGSSWVQKGSDIDGEAANDQSAQNISMPDANTIAIGAALNDGNGTDSGHTRVYTWNGTAWVLLVPDMNGPGPNENSGFGISMPDANTIGIGTLNNDINGTNCGMAQVFKLCANSASILNLSECNFYVSPSGNFTWTTSGTYNDIIPNASGCDSLMTIHLTINNSYAGSENITACNSYTWPANGNTYTSSTSDVANLTGVNGCDSTLYLQLTINTVASPSVSQAGDSLIGFVSASAYLWYDCIADTALTGQTMAVFYPQTSGDYALIVSDNGCTDTSSCLSFVATNFKELLNSHTIQAFPNPAKDLLQLKGNTNKIQTLEIYSIEGKLVNRQNKPGQAWILVNHLAPGVYYLKIIQTDIKEEMIRFIKD